MACITELVKRPGLGRVGRPINIRTNYFEITALPSSDIYHYNIVITPKVPPALNRKVFQVAENSNFFGGVRPVFDGHRNIYTVKQFPFGNFATFDVEYNANNTGRRLPRSFKVRIRKVAVITMEEIHRFNNGNSFIWSNVLTG